MLTVKSLNAWYGPSHVLQGISFEVKKGEVVSLLGRNGAKPIVAEFWIASGRRADDVFFIQRRSL